MAKKVNNIENLSEVKIENNSITYNFVKTVGKQGENNYQEVAAVAVVEDVSDEDIVAINALSEQFKGYLIVGTDLVVRRKQQSECGGLNRFMNFLKKLNGGKFTISANKLNEKADRSDPKAGQRKEVKQLFEDKQITKKQYGELLAQIELGEYESQS